MAEFLITAPNGKQYKVTGATREGALAALKRQLEGAPAQAPVNPEGTGVGRAIERGVLRTGQGLNLNTAANASQQLRSQDVDPLTSLNRILDRHLGQYPGTLEAIRNNDELRALDRVPIDAWVTQIARDYDIKPEVAERIAIDFKRIEAGKAEMREEGGRFDQIRDKGEAALAAASDKQQRIDALPMSPTAQRGAQDFQEAEGVREWAASAFKDPIGALAFIGEVASEATPGIAAGVGTSVITGNPLAGAGVMILASSPQTFSGEFVEFLREQDIDISDPEAIKDALANDDILATAQKRGYTKAAIVGMFEALGMKGGGGILKQTFKQGFTGGAGEASSDYVLNGQIDWKEAALEAVAEVATVPGEAAVMTTRKIVNKDGNLPDLNSLSGNEKQAGADVARLLRELAQSEGYNLRDTNVSSEKGGKKALEAARKRIIDRLRVLKSDPAIKQFLSPKQRRSLAQLIDDFAPADGAFRAANNKVSDRVTQEQFDAVMRLLPPSKEASEIANLLMMSNQVTDLFNSGLKGGLSQYTDYFNPFIKDGSYDPSRAANIIVGTGAGLTLGPLATAGIVAGGRTFDFVTGRRASALDRYVRKNEKSAGLPDPKGASLIDMAQSANDAAAARKEQEAALKEQRKQESKDLNLELTRKNAPPTPDSPQDTLEVGTGLNRNNVARILRILKARNDTPPALLRAIRDYEQSVAAGGKAKDLSPLIRAVKQFQQENPGYVGLDFQPNDSTRAPIVDQTPAQDTPTPDVMSEAPTFGPQMTTPENYNRGIEANRTAAQTLSLQAQNDADLSVQDKAVIASALDKLQGNLGANPVMNAEAIMEAAVNAGVPQEAIDAYVKPYVDRVARQQTRPTAATPGLQAAQEAGVAPTTETQGPVQPEVQSQAPEMPEFDQAINPDIPAPTTVQTAALSAPTPVVHQQIDAPAGQTNHGLLPHLRVEAPTAREGKPLVLAGTNNKNASRQIDGIDEVLARHEDPAGSPEAWASMLGDAMATKDVPVQPHGFIEDLNNGGAQELLSTLTPGQIADADHGFRNAAEFREAYTNGEIGIEDTGRLFLWSFLSRGVSPYTQEGLFMDSFNGIEEWIRMAAGKSNRGTLADNIKDYEKWAKSAAPKGSGQPGAGATHNLNAFGNTFLMKMSQDAGKGDGRSRLQVIHDMMSDPNTTGKEVRREFLRMGEGVGIDNKVVSFTLLVAGYDDVMVLDRVQMRQMWNDGRFSGINLYDGYKSDGKPVTGSALSSLTYGARGLLVYEAMEKSLQNRLSQIYSDVGRPEAASVGRYHWETWVASSQQEASHGTIDAILKRAKGDPNPLDGVTAKEGEYGAYAYGARYGVENGVPMFTYEVPGHGEFKFTVPDFQKFLEDIKKPKNKVVPTKFKVTESGNAPWYTREGVNLDALAEKAKEHGKQIRTADAELRQGPAVPDGRTPDAPSAEPALFPALSRGNEGTAGSGDTTGSQPGGSLPVTTLGRIKQALTRHRAAYQVGKKGSEFENGIQDMETALSFAKAMGQTVRLFNSMESLNNEIDRQGLPGSGSTAAIFYKGTKLDPFGKWYLDPKAKGFEGLVFALKPGATRPDGSKVNDTEALMYLLHEISHGLTLGNIEGGAQGKSTPFANPVSRTNDSVTPNSFAGSALYPLVMNSNFKQRDAVLEEISNVQVNLDAFTTNNPGERAAVRNVRKLIAQHDRAKAEGASESELFTYKQNLSEYAEYMENIRETAVDPVWIYLMNPSLAKKVMPKTTALIQSEFNKAKDPKIQFYSHPLAVVAAVVAAMLAQGEEDEKQKQMPPGALNQPMMPGALSA